MKTREMERALGAANPVGRGRLDGLDLEATEAGLFADLEAGCSTLLEPEAAPPHARGPRRFVLALGSGAVAVVLALVVLLAGGTSDRPSRAYGAELVRFAESTPLLLLEGPGWRVQDVSEERGGEGSMEFVTGKPVPDETIQVTGNVETGQHEAGMLPAAVRQRRVVLRWRHGSLEESLAAVRRTALPHGQRWTEAPVLGTTAQIDTRAEVFVNQGGPGDRQMDAFWSEGGYLLELSAAVPDLGALEERLGWLQKVDSQTWLDAMPAKVVKAADHDAAVREMLKGIPRPAGFDPKRIPDYGLTTNRDQMGATVAGTVSCLWFRQWGEARRNGDRSAAAEAERAMASARHWPILREMAKDSGFPRTVWQLAAAMPSGVGRRGWRLLPQAEALGCAREGIPVLPWKQRRQREREEPQSP